METESSNTNNVTDSEAKKEKLNILLDHVEATAIAAARVSMYPSGPDFGLSLFIGLLTYLVMVVFAMVYFSLAIGIFTFLVVTLLVSLYRAEQLSEFKKELNKLKQERENLVNDLEKTFFDD